MPREGVDLYNEIGSTPEALREALMQLRQEFEARKDSDYQKLINLIVSNISISAGGADNPIGTIGRDPQSQNIWGFIAERGYGFHARYLRANYARFFVDAGNDSGHSTPSLIIDLPTPNKMVLKDNESNTIWRTYGRGAQEVGFASNYFRKYGAFDLFCPFRLFTYNYAGGTAGGPEVDSDYCQEGFMYYRQNYGTTKINDVRVFKDNAWTSLVAAHPEAAGGAMFVADTVCVRESVTVSIT